MIRHAVVVESKLAPAAARASFLAWSQSVGYRPATPAFLSSIQFERGSIGWNAVTVNPQRWRSDLSAKFDPDGDGSRVELEWKIVTAGQLVTRVDVDYWRYEVAQATAAAQGGPVDPAETNHLQKRAVSGNVWRALLLTTVSLGPLVLGIFMYQLWLPLTLLAVLLSAGTYIGMRSPRRL
ncbi:MAG: hypothetical protein ACO1SV_11110 [Fimbriimonas sp.]